MNWKVLKDGILEILNNSTIENSTINPQVEYFVYKLVAGNETEPNWDLHIEDATQNRTRIMSAMEFYKCPDDYVNSFLEADTISDVLTSVTDWEFDCRPSTFREKWDFAETIFESDPELFGIMAEIIKSEEDLDDLIAKWELPTQSLFMTVHYKVSDESFDELQKVCKLGLKAVAHKYNFIPMDVKMELINE